MHKEKEKQTGYVSASRDVFMDSWERSLCLARVAAIFCRGSWSRALADTAGRGFAFLCLRGIVAFR